MDIIFKGRHTDVLDRFRKHATGKIARLEKLDYKAIRVDVEVTAEHNPRQSGTRERVELTITTRGPAIRAEAAAEDRYAALDLALGKLEMRLRRACDRRKPRRAATRPEPAGVSAGGRGGTIDADAAAARTSGTVPMSRPAPQQQEAPAAAGASAMADSAMDEDAIADAGLDADLGPARPGDGEETIIPIAMEGDGPLVVREKLHVACPMSIDQALFEMEMVGHDFFLFTDTAGGLPSVVYRRRGYQYGVIRLVEEDAAAGSPLPPGLANGHSPQAANLASG